MITPRNLTIHAVGAALLGGAAGWLYKDVAPDGQIAFTTGVGVSVMGALGGLLIDKVLVLDLLSSFTVALRGVFIATKAGSDDVK